MASTTPCSSIGHRDKQQKHTQQSLAVSAAAKHSTFFTRQANTNEAH
ncbi:predicted protein [Botrytis cinerea T4]|uniref:Uncharacterized protein n=1 Tax=Botryotinia fuckeliana (strain T4) TaxID=999810 RepID=G2Y7Z1_BOTF4|nr:predicted protein [Botrytis cinerea T4]